MRIINKSDKAELIKLGSKWIHFEKGQVKEGFPDDFLILHKDYANKFSKLEEDNNESEINGKLPDGQKKHRNRKQDNNPK